MAKVLVIEDNEKVADVILQILRKKGIDAVAAPDGAAGLQAFENGSFDLLLVDVNLPQLAGDELCRRLRSGERGRSVPIILMSGYVKEPTAVEVLRQELGISAFLTKPFTSDALLAAVGAALPAADPAAASAPPAAAAARQPQNIQGDLSRTPFEKVLWYLLRNRGTGSLTVTRGQAMRRFLFIGGAPVEAEIRSGDDDFGTYLSRRNLVNSAELAAYRVQRTRREDDPRDLFVKMGCLTPERFNEENRSFLNDRLVDCFGWRTGSVLFTWRPAFIRDSPAAAVFLPGVFYRGFREHLPAAALSAFLDAKGDQYVSKLPAFYDYQNHLAALVPSQELFGLINGLSTCSGIASVLDSEDTAVMLYTLDYLQAVSYSPAPQRSSLAPAFPVREAAPKQREQPEEVEAFEDLGGELSELAGEIGNIVAQQAPASSAAAGPGQDQAELERDLRKQWEAVRDRNYYEIFGMTQNSFSFEELKKAYFRLTKAYGPEKFFASSGEVMELAEEFLSRVSNAYSTLSNVVSKENYDALLTSQAPTSAEEKKFYEQVQFQSGKVMLEQGQYEAAEKAFTECWTINPDKAEYQVYLAVAVYHNPANRGNPASVKRAKELVNKSLLWEKTSIAYALKGTMLLDEGLTNLAEAEFNKALKLNANNKTALKKLEQIRQKKEEEEKKGFFQKMFK